MNLHIPVGLLHLWGVWLFSTLNSHSCSWCPRTSAWARCSAWVYFSGAYVSDSRDSSLEEKTSETFFSPSRTRERTWTHSFSLHKTTAAQVKETTMVNSKSSQRFFPACISPQIFDTFFSPRRSEIKTHWPPQNPLDSRLRTQVNRNPGCQLLPNLYWKNCSMLKCYQGTQWLVQEARVTVNFTPKHFVNRGSVHQWKTS